MTRAIDYIIALAACVAILGIGAMDAHDDAKLAEHVAQRDREIAQEAALRRQAEWAALLHRGQRMTGFPEVAGK